MLDVLFLIIFSWWSTKIVDPHFKGFSMSPFVLILEKCWEWMQISITVKFLIISREVVTLQFLCRHLKPSLAAQKKSQFCCFSKAVFSKECGCSELVPDTIPVPKGGLKESRRGTFHPGQEKWDWF